MSKENLSVGKRGEEEAVRLLKENGYRILSRNYKTKLGEIDIIALDKGTYCFIEVKARNSLRFGAAQEAVSGFKQRQISKAALVFLKENRLFNKPARFDVVTLTYTKGKLERALIKNAFELDADYSI